MKITRQGECRLISAVVISVFVDMVAVLVVAVPVMQVVNVVAVLDCLVAIAVKMGSFMVLMDHFFRMQFTVVLVVNVPVMFDRLVAVTGQVLMVLGRVSFGHLNVLSGGTNPSDCIDNDNRCQFV